MTEAAEKPDYLMPAMGEYLRKLSMWWHDATGSETDLVARLNEMTQADIYNKTKLTLGAIVLLLCVSAPEALLRRRELFLPWPKESKEFTASRAAVGTQNGVLNALIRTGLIVRSGTGVHMRYTARQEKAKRALVDVIDGDGSILKLALWPGGQMPDAEALPAAGKAAMASVEPETHATKVDPEQRRVQLDALTVQQYASALPEIIRILTSLDAGVKSSMAATDRIVTALDVQRQAMAIESSSFNALKDAVQVARDAQMKTMREIALRVEGVAASVAKVTESAPLAALIEQLRLGYDQALRSAESFDQLKRRVEGAVPKQGGERG